MDGQVTAFGAYTRKYVVVDMAVAIEDEVLSVKF